MQKLLTLDLSGVLWVSSWALKEHQLVLFFTQWFLLARPTSKKEPCSSLPGYTTQTVGSLAISWRGRNQLPLELNLSHFSKQLRSTSQFAISILTRKHCQPALVLVVDVAATAAFIVEGCLDPLVPARLATAPCWQQYQIVAPCIRGHSWKGTLAQSPGLLQQLLLSSLFLSWALSQWSPSFPKSWLGIAGKSFQ